MLVVNSLISFTTSDNQKVIERVLWLDRQQDICYLINIYTDQLPFYRSIIDIEDSISRGYITIEMKDP